MTAPEDELIKNITPENVHTKTVKDLEGHDADLLKQFFMILRGRTPSIPDEILEYCGIPTEKRSKGLGDSIKKVTEKLGIKQCGGCKKRQENLNRLFPYKEEDKKED